MHACRHQVLLRDLSSANRREGSAIEHQASGSYLSLTYRRDGSHDYLVSSPPPTCRRAHRDRFVAVPSSERRRRHGERRDRHEYVLGRIGPSRAPARSSPSSPTGSRAPSRRPRKPPARSGSGSWARTWTSSSWRRGSWMRSGSTWSIAPPSALGIRLTAGVQTCRDSDDPCVSPTRLHDDVFVAVGPARLTIDVAAVRRRMIDEPGARPDVPVERVEYGPAFLERRPLRLGAVDRVEGLFAGSRSPSELASLCVHALTLQLKERFSYPPPADDEQRPSSIPGASPVEPIPGSPSKMPFNARESAQPDRVDCRRAAGLPSRATHRPLERSLR